jgi:transcriptional regulator with XRE-family HTH domain
MDFYRQTNKALLAELGARLRMTRLNQNITQEQLAEHSGLGKGAVCAAEKGGNITLLNLLRIMRSLRTLEQIDLLLPDTGPSPLELAKLRGKQRIRARKKRRETQVKLGV